MTPLFLLTIFGTWLVQSLPDKISAMKEQPEVLLTVYCFYRVLRTPGSEKHKHAMLEIDTRDNDLPEK